jgi:hypothetical protein
MICFEEGCWFRPASSAIPLFVFKKTGAGRIYHPFLPLVLGVATD